MKFSRRLGRLTVLMTVLGALIILFLLVFGLTVANHQKQSETLLRSMEEELQREYDIILGMYEEMAELVFRLQIDRPEVAAILTDALEATDPETEDIQRRLLHEELLDTYDQLVLYNFRQLHFHNPDNISFLRFHRPAKYGDDLTDIRRTVALVNAGRRYVSGFEEGRIFNGYRFVFPLGSAGRHLGSVEVSVSMASLVRKMDEIFSGRTGDTQFILSRDVVMGKVFQEEQSNYVEWALSDKFMLDRDLGEQCILEPVDDDVKKRVRDTLESLDSSSLEPFSIVSHRGDDPLVVNFIPVNNIEGKTVGWFFSYGSYEVLRDKRRDFLLVMGVLLLLILLLVVFSVYFYFTQRNIERMAIYDSLTGLFSRDVLMEQIAREDERFDRYGTPYSLIMIDIDHFKNVNDTHGHPVGDVVLKGVATILEYGTRKTDIVGRYGGEEFTVVLPVTGLDDARNTAEKLRKKMEQEPFGSVGHITISCGVSERNQDFAGYDGLIRDADEKLYRAKAAGRNRVEA